MLSKPYVKLSVFQGFYTKQIFCKPIVFLRFAREANLMSTQEFAKVCMRRKSIVNSKHSTGLHVLQTDCKLKYLHKSLQRFAHWPFRQPPLLRSVCHQVPIQGLRVCKSGKLMQIKHLQQVCLCVCTRAYQIFRLLVRFHTCIPCNWSVQYLYLRFH